MNIESVIEAIDAERLQTRIEALGEIGREGGSLFRPVYGPAWLDARNLVESWMRDAGLNTRVDAVGNLIGRLEGEIDDEVVLSGSHIDTVPEGGMYDGALGIHAALCAVGAIAASGLRLRRPIEVVAFCEEESSRFDCAYWGSRAIHGQIASDEPETIFDADGVSIGTAMRSLGLDPSRIPEAKRDDLAAFVELHIEQGRVMETKGALVGVVEAITGLKFVDVKITGDAAHAGTTPMKLRNDALVGAAEAVVAIERLAQEIGDPGVATVGSFVPLPNASNVVAREVHFSIDMRHPDGERLNTLMADIEREITAIADRRSLEVQIEVLESQVPTPMSSAIRAVIEKAVSAQGVPALSMPSGAGHDSQVFATQVPTGMIFTPSSDGVSHNPREYTAIEDIVPGVQVLARTLVALAEDRGNLDDGSNHHG